MIRSDGAGSKDELRTPFVERRTYRRRRLMDIARLAPLIGALLFLVPLLWPERHLSEGGGHDAGSSMSTAMIYIFGVWIGLILFSVAFSVAVRLWAVHWTGVGAPTETADVLAMRQPGDDRANDRVDTSPSTAPLPPASAGPEDQL
ncbi:hypothetical protein [Tritonibacter mobilis]|uniref:hypothetical protein n=1 Tax=Tritonibacter mobilis TaxID=379347 RepID=UPI001C093093|nr:hypothetical protein [Tritonibacter mobilis]MBU3035172.1 hypothetical protein [Tritonibacter mobilis]WHQ83636.1 hypothetical protein OMR53_05930 [Tritonibacter mobilis]